MIHRVEIKDNSSPHFERCWGLYESAFPAEERREADYQMQTLACADYHFDAILDDAILIGIVGWWDFEEYIYIEHLATLPECRGCGYGAQILSIFKQMRGVLLEVEHPVDDITRRRIEFYRREGFVLNMHSYSHPPYRGVQRVELLLMTYPAAISVEDVEVFGCKYFTIIHFR